MKEAKFKNDRIKSIIFLVIASMLWSTGGILIKLIDWNPIAIAGMRSFIASMTIFIYLRKLKLTFSKAQVGGAIAYAATVILFVIANKLTTSANAVLLQYTAPIFVALLGVKILKEKIYGYDWITIVCVFGGMILFFVDSVGIGSMLGNIIAVASGFFLACTTVAFRFQKDASPVETTWLGNIITFVVAIPFIFQAMPNMKSIFGLILLGVFQLGIPYIFYSFAIKHLTAIEAILIMVIEPLLNPIWVFIFAGEKPSFFAIIGGIIVLSSVTARNIYVNKKADNPSSV